MVSTESRHEGGGPANSSAEMRATDAPRTAGADGAEIFILDPGNAPVQAMEEMVILELEDLLPDASGEVVLFAGEELPVTFVTHEPVTDAGIAEAHVTAAGVDVTRQHFYSFESGITLYSPTDLLIVIDSGVT